MASVTHDKLTWIYTNYGLRRVTEVMQNPDDKLAITKLVVGDSEVITYDEVTGIPIYHYDYYTPDPAQDNLKHPVDSFFFHGKELDAENNIIKFITNVPENAGGYTINEMGLFEDGNLLAICTCQGLAKPSIDDNYIMAINYTIALHSYNLSTIYDQIVLNVDSEYLQPHDLEKVQYSILYMEGNLAEQISQNSHWIGLNRARQLEQLIDSNVRTSATALLTNIYNNFGALVGYSNVKNFWVFDYSRYLGTKNCILDMGFNGERLNLSTELRTADVAMRGLCPVVTLTDTVNFSSENSIVDAGDNTWFFLLQHTNASANAVIMAKSDYAKGKHEFEILRHIDRSLEVRVYTENGNYVSFTSNEDIVPETMYALAITIPEDFLSNNVSCMVDGRYVHLNKLQVGAPNAPAHYTDIGYSSFIMQEEALAYPSDSTVGVMVKLKGSLETAEVKGMSLTLSALAGNNVCMNFK